MPAKVADASIMAAIVFGEPRAGEAAFLLDDADVVAPRLLAYELTSIARTKTRRTPELGDSIARALVDGLAVDYHWAEVDHLDVLRLALETGLSTYDASYLSVARSQGLELVTFDQRLREASSNP
jgi:predicted nucleic acid-binding protein